MDTLRCILLPFVFLLISCSSQDIAEGLRPSGTTQFTKAEVARIISDLPLRQEHLAEVHDAVNSSSGNGYDEEYTMASLFSSPGTGVGGAATKAQSYENPIRDLFSAYLSDRYSTKAGAADVEACIRSISESDMQIYWPYSEDWDGKTYPLVTFDPGYGSESNYGYEIRPGESGLEVIDSVLVTESVAQSRPVWVINSNDDAEFKPLLMRSATTQQCGTKAGTGKAKMLTIKSFKALRNYDSWFAGASEFFIKCGAVDGFKATTDDELKLYTPAVTDFMIVVKRSKVRTKALIGSILLSDYTDQMEKVAFLIVEDDGGTTTSWKCSAVVKYKSKSFGFDMEIPYKDKDDIVWRGQLASSFFGIGGAIEGHFGDVVVTFLLE